ncbi:MAG: hypothetical protein ACI96M_002516 [Candidatus Azotimanducaceae bacterium]|jgi:hypothetical protein
MSYRKRSDRAIDYGLTRFWKGLRNAHYTRTTVRTLMLTFGLSLSIFFPMLEMTSTPGSASKGDTGDQGVVGSRGERGPTGDRGPEGGLSGDAYNTIYEGFVGPIYKRLGDLDVRIDELGTDNTIVKVMAEGLSIISVPPISVQWHRAAFENSGDMFWAIPTRDLTFVLAGNPTQCTRLGGCNVQFNVRSDIYNIPRDQINLLNIGDSRVAPTFTNMAPLERRMTGNRTLQKRIEANRDLQRLINENPDLQIRAAQNRAVGPIPNDPACKVKRQDYEEFLYCEFRPKAITVPVTPAVCMHIKRSATEESVDNPNELVELVALDVRWGEIRNNQCPIGEGV